MDKNLVIVESPAKAKTIQKFIGEEYEVISSKGHVRDLPEKTLGVDIEHQFAPDYTILTDKKALIAEIKKKAKEAHTVWLATDDDREGEAISWHLMESASIPKNKVKRIVFHEITKSAIENALANPREVDIDLVNAQQARRILDRIVGFELSPVLWRKVKPQLSAGRVQSVAVKLIVEREHEIQKFETASFYKVNGAFITPKKEKLEADLNVRFELEKEAKNFLEHCKIADFLVEAVEKSPGKKSPAAPYTTSTLQQEAFRKLGFSVSKTMMVAQQLYEAGYITYMRTDSVNISEFALNDIKNQIVNQYGEEYYKRRKYTVKSKNAQEAHEAIRPTLIQRTSVDMDASCNKLYELVWKRSIASQMSDAAIEKTTITIPVSGKTEKFLAIGEVILFQGFLKVYIESKDEEDEEIKGLLPKVEVGEKLQYASINAVQKYSQPPARYTEASLVKKMEELGIGRPSTFAPTISTVQKREYVVKESRDGKERPIKHIILVENAIKEEIKKEKYGYEKDKLFPTDIGSVVNEYLQENFNHIMDYGFTAAVEQKFDDIAEGTIEWQQMLDNFYQKFHTAVDTALTTSSKASGNRLLGQDPATGNNVYVRLGKFGPMAQLGEVSDDYKPKYARLKATQSIETITFEEAMKLFELPKYLGQYEGADVVVGIGRFGAYVKFNDQFVSIPKGEEPAGVTMKRAIELIKSKKQLDAERAPRLLGKYEDKELFVVNGRFGPYIRYDDKNIKIDKNSIVADMTFEDAVKYLTQKDNNELLSFPADSTLKVLNGRYGAYISNGKNNFKIPKTMNPITLTFEEVKNIVETTTPTAKKARRFTKK
ncbi:MAG: type I DNA topoisomerase [Bacteroidales bacterium]|jgi:DNA topoisomerase-1|nr:type I DNA topoisomerase [Bacteroidales bacterium]